MQTLQVVRIRKDAVIPTRATAGAAGFDLSACMDAPVTLAPGERALIGTGLAIRLPEQTAGMVYARSGLAVRAGLALANGVGVIDWDYTGEIRVGMINLSQQAYTIKPGDRIAQLVVTPVLTPPVEETDALEQTERGAGGFGSTGR